MHRGLAARQWGVCAEQKQELVSLKSLVLQNRKRKRKPARKELNHVSFESRNQDC